MQLPQPRTAPDNGTREAVDEATVVANLPLVEYALAELRGRVTEDLATLGVDTQKLGDETFEARSEYAYPLMDLGYQARRNEAIKALMPINNLIMTGRQGTFRYIFTDTAMEMGMMAADMVIDGVDRRHAIFNHRNENTVIETQSVA